jgi:nucleoside-diphosphate-sugar epimerase
VTYKYSRILVTGGAGFIGSHLVDRLLSNGFEVTVIDNLTAGRLENMDFKDRQNFHFIEGDIRDFDLIKKALEDIDAVFHEAALVSVVSSFSDPLNTHDVNVKGTLNLLKACLDSDVRRFVFASSAAIYGKTKTPQKRENMIGMPTSPYAVSKLAAESYVKLFYKAYGLETVSLRYFNVYGPRQRYGPYSAVIPTFINRVLNDQPPIIHGDGEQTRDFVNVQDVVDANMIALRSKNAVGQVFNVGTGKATSVNQLAKIVLKILGKTSLEPVHTALRLGDASKGSCADINRARKVLGFNAGVSLEEGMAKLVEWYRCTRAGEDIHRND